MNSDQSAQITFRCSSLGDLMSSGRGASKEDKIAKKKADIADQLGKISKDVEAGKTHLKTSQARIEKLAILKAELHELESKAEELDDILGETAKSACRNIVLKNIYGGLEEVESDATRHGNQFEPLAIMQYGELIGANRAGEHLQFRKNLERRTLNLGTELNPYYLSGEPDVVFDNIIWDIKCPFSISNFEQQTRQPVLDYILQVHGYMLLFNLEKAIILTCLFRNKNIKIDTIFDNTPRALRYHAYEIDRDEDLIDAIKCRLELCAQYAQKVQKEYSQQKGFSLYKKFR